MEVAVAYSSSFIYVRAIGHFGASTTAVTEKWNVGLKILHGGTPPSGSSLLAFLTAIAPAYTTFHQNSSLLAGTSTYLDTLTAALIGTDGKYVGGGAQATTVYNYATPPTGLGSPAMPLSTACVISLRTQFSRGLASNGRMYWPAIANTVPGTTGLWSTGTTGGIATAAKVLLDAINTAAQSGFDSSHKVSVMSNVGSGQAANVTSVRVDGRPDRQERRERDLLSTYSVASLTTATALEALNADLPIGASPHVVL